MVCCTVTVRGSSICNQMVPFQGILTNTFAPSSLDRYSCQNRGRNNYERSVYVQCLHATERIHMYWWGYSETHGWVVLDRTIPCNSSGSGGALLFFRCSDSQTFSVPRDTWKKPNFIYAPNYLGGRTKDDAIEFEALKTETEHRLETIRQENLRVELEKQKEHLKLMLEKKQLQAIENHQNFLKNKGLQYHGVAARNVNKFHRVTHCYSCKDSLDNEIDSECAACRWIICECGACGCGYSRF